MTTDTDRKQRPSDVRLLGPIADEFAAAIRLFGANHRGVFWSSADGQLERFRQLAAIFDKDDMAGGVSINDLGCGYGALFEFLADHPALAGGRYAGFDITPEMVAAASTRITDPRARFECGCRPDAPADYAFVSGTFNLRVNVPDDEWANFIRKSLLDLATTSRKGIAFNMLQTERNGRRPKEPGSLYYTRPEPFFDFCRRALSEDVTLVQGYGLPEWTLLVRFGESPRRRETAAI
jgi:SAM-dependent methyltransferase